MKPPLLARKPSHTFFHNIKREDEFAWVRADNWQEILKDPTSLPQEIKTYLEKENDYFDDLLSPVASLQKELLAEMKARIPDRDKQVPLPDGEFIYWQEFAQGQEQPCFFQQPKNAKNSADKKLLLDADVLNAQNDFFKLGETEHSTSHSYFAYAADVSGGEFYDITITSIESGQIIDTIKGCDGSFVWDETDIYYTTLDERHRPFEVKKHRLGTPQARDEVVFTNQDPAFFLSIDKPLASGAGGLLFINVYDHDSSEVFILKHKELHKVKARQQGIEYDLEYDKANKRFFILTNEQAVDFKIMVADEKTPHLWREAIAHQQGDYILNFALFEHYLVRLVRSEGLPKLIVRSLKNDAEYQYQFSTEPHQLHFSSGYEYKTETLRLFYSSPRQPQQTFDFNLTTQEKTLLKTQEVQGGHNPDDFVCEMRAAKTKDGNQIPISIFYHKATPPAAERALWLYGYGAYGITITPSFSSHRLSLVKRGITFALAHVRGGAMKGRSWYLDGKLENKPNTFHDFITCAQHLIAHELVAKGNIIAQGGSAGGMLMGAIANTAPDLFRAIIAQVPFVDVLATMLDDTLPLTPPEWLEWGNPIKSKSAYHTIAAYSPYDNVKPQPYPWILATSGVSDPRVGYWEATKWVARLRQAQQADNPIALKTEMSAGHAGKSGRFAALHELAEVYSFAMRAIRTYK